MSKSIGKIFGSSSSKPYEYENTYLEYLKNYDTSKQDSALNNMTTAALEASKNLATMPDYKFNIDGSDEARKRAEEATYQRYLNKLLPQHKQQTEDLSAQLINQGLSVGSEAYQRAMTDLQEQQNASLNEVAYQSVLNGQNAFSQSLKDEQNSADFANKAQANYINQILSLLQGSPSGYENASNIYAMQTGVHNRITNNNESGWNRLGNIASGVVSSGIGDIIGKLF